MTRRLKLFTVLCLFVCFLSGCGSDKSALKSALSNVELTHELPEVEIVGCRYLREADDAVYEQQIAACEMYYEAYELTETNAYKKVYKKGLKTKNVAYYCNKRRQELQLDIATQLNDNVYEMIKSVEDCENITAYLQRVNYDVVNFYDYYMAYMRADDGDNSPACRMLMYFYERNNVLAFRFMGEHKDEIIEMAVETIVENSHKTEEHNKYISINNELIKALNTVYGGVSASDGEIITMANIELVRHLLEEDNELDNATIDKLMQQLGEPTPAPTEAPTPTPTAEPTESPEHPETAERPAVPTPRPAAPTPRPAAPTPRPAAPTRTSPPVTEPSVQMTPEVYTFGY